MKVATCNLDCNHYLNGGKGGEQVWYRRSADRRDWVVFEQSAEWPREDIRRGLSDWSVVPRVFGTAYTLWPGRKHSTGRSVI